MQKEANIKTYTATELKFLRANGGDMSNWEKIESMTDEELEEIIANDPDEQLIVDWSKTEAVFPEKKGSVILDADVIQYFKNLGKEYQAQINNVLRSYILNQQLQSKSS